MLNVAEPHQVNELIQELSSKDRSALLSDCEQVELSFGDIVCEAHQVYTYVYFPSSAFVSLVIKLEDHHPLEMALIGKEGMVGASLALGVDVAPIRGVVQGDGVALRISSSLFRQHLSNQPLLVRLLHRYIYVQMAQLAQSAACTRFHQIEPRLARWLLMTHDRAPDNSLTLTHEFLAEMLGVRRSGITIAAGALQARGLISYSRGEIQILDRSGLESAACECYGVQQMLHHEMFG